MLLQITWSPWIGTPFATDLNLKAAAIIYSRVTQPLEGAGLRVLYMAERVSCQLMGEDMPQVPMDPPLFMLAPLFAMWPILLWVALLTHLTYLGWSIPTALMALLKGVLWDVTWMSWATLFLKTHERWVPFILFLCTFLFAILRPAPTLSSFQFQPTIVEYKELVWLAGKLKLEVTEYSR